MADLVLESTSKANAGATTITITKPTGLADGDLMVFAGVSSDQLGDPVTISTKSGWTLVNNVGGSGELANIQYKVADSSDAAASNFVFTKSTNGQAAGALFRISNYFASSLVEDSATATTGAAAVDTTVALTPSLDFTVQNCLIIAALAVGDNVSGSPATISAYTSTPTLTWTELVDMEAEFSDGNDVGGSIVYATNSGTTSLSAFGATLSNGFDDHVLAMVAIRPNYPTSGTNSLLSIPVINFNQAGSSGVSANSEFLEVTTSTNSQSGQATAPIQWTEQTKEATTWTDKNI